MALPHARERVPTRQDLGGGSRIGTLDARRIDYGEDRRGRADHTPIADTLSKKLIRLLTRVDLKRRLKHNPACN
jgi:hypothetical protein